MEIIAALFMDDVQLRSVPGPSTRIDLSGIQFSAPAPAPPPVTVAPHLVVLVWNPPSGDQFGALEVVFHLADDEGQPMGDELARNAQPLDIQPGMFAYRLVRADLEFPELGTAVASCRIGSGNPTRVPYTLLPPVS